MTNIPNITLNINSEQNDNAPINDMAFSTDLAFKMIPEFDGQRSNLHKFLSCGDVVWALASTRANQQMFMNIAKCKLSGPAYNIIKYKTFADWQELKVALENQYLERRTIAQIQSELINSRQKPNEDVRSFANRIERLNIDLNDACIASEGQAAQNIVENLNKKSALKAFVDGLRHPIQLIIKASRFDDFSNAVEAACEEERSLRSNNKNISKSYSNIQLNKKIICFKCGKANHTSDQCYSNSRIPNYPHHSPVNIKSEGNVRFTQIECRYCKKFGHTLEECRKRKYNNSRNRNLSQNQSQSKSSADHSKSDVTNSSIQQGNEQGPSTSGSGTRAQNLKTAKF